MAMAHRAHVRTLGDLAPTAEADGPSMDAPALVGTLAVVDDWLDGLGLLDMAHSVLAGICPGTPEEILDHVLAESETILAGVRGPLDAEVWGSEILGMITVSGLEPAALDDLMAQTVVPMVEASGSPTALAMVVVLEALGGDRLRRAATEARRHLVAAGISEPDWAEGLGAPRLGPCWVYRDAFGDQESMALTFAYGRKRHALCVLVDHELGGGVKDAYVTEHVPTLRKHMFEMAEDDPIAWCDELASVDVAPRLGEALAAPECPAAFDQIESVTATRALLHSRVRLMLGSERSPT